MTMMFVKYFSIGPQVFGLKRCPATIITKILVHMIRLMRLRVLYINIFVQHDLQVDEKFFTSRNSM